MDGGRHKETTGRVVRQPTMKRPGHPRDEVPADWNPHAPDVMADQRAAYDAMRSRCPVARDPTGGWTIFRHADVMDVLHDHETFSSVVSRHLSVPNGMDPPIHTRYRQLVESYFTGGLVAAFEPLCRDLAADLVNQACRRRNIELMTDVALPFAARAQCAYLGWPTDLADPLIAWTKRNHEATRAGDRDALAAIAHELESMVNELIRARRAQGRRAPTDLTDRLIGETIDGRHLTPSELTSLLRNWTMGEVGTIAASVGILVHELASNLTLQYQLRRHMVMLPGAIDEILRVHGPLLGNRRTVTRPVEIGGRLLDTGSRLTINWIAANRDPEAFENVTALRLDRDPTQNLLYGAGVHVCPGALLARLELRVLMEELLAATYLIEPIMDRPATLARPPASGYAILPLHVVQT